jgi:hypothetical protein
MLDCPTILIPLTSDHAGASLDFTLLHHGELMKISKNKAQCRNFFLFPAALVYAKRDKGLLSVKGILSLNDMYQTGGWVCSI